MPRKKKTDDPIGVGLTAKQMRRKKPINSDLLVDIDPLTDNQEKFYKAYDEGKHLFAFGCAGIAIDKSWDNYPGIHVFNTTGHGDTNQGQFRFHGWNRSYSSYVSSSGSDFSVNLVCDGTGLTSDERRKTGISTITNALDTVSQLRGVKYTQVNRELTPQTHMTMDNGQKLGFIAQEVIPHLPSIVIDSCLLYTSPSPRDS